MQHDIPPTPQNLYPVMGSLLEVQQLAESQLPITDRNQLISILMSYHNTLLKQLDKASLN